MFWLSRKPLRISTASLQAATPLVAPVAAGTAIATATATQGTV